MNWTDLELTGAPQLVVGLRDKRRRLTGYRVDVDADVHPGLREVADTALAEVGSRTSLAFTPYVDPEEGEYLTIDVAGLKPKPVQRRGAANADEDAPTASDEHAALVAMITGSDYLEQLGAGQLMKQEDDAFYLQAICLKAAEERIGFVTRTNPRQVLKRSRIFLGRNDVDDRLRRLTEPQLVLETDVHAIVTGSEIAVLNRNMFQNMVADTVLISSHVPAQVKVIAKRFKARGLTLTPATASALQQQAQRSPRLAKRLSAFADRIDQIDTSAIISGEGFIASDLVKEDFVTTEGEIDCAPDRVPELLDALEGRFFDDPFSPEHRRADRFRRRRSPPAAQ